MTDQQLLQKYIRGERQAFDELVRRHLNLVYSAARRQAPQAADDIVQAVFLLLAQKAGGVSGKVSLAGWLYRAARYCCANVNKMENRRRHYEREAASMSIQTRDQSWENLLPLLDHAVDALAPREREAVLLRYFEAKTIEQTAMQLGITPAAVSKRAQRGLEKLRIHFARLGYAVPTVALDGLVAAEAAKAAPASAAQSVHTAIAAGESAASPAVISLLNGAQNMMLAAKIKSLAAVAALCLLIAALAAGVTAQSLAPAATQASTTAPSTTASEITVDSDFDCATPVDSDVDAPNHVTITFQQRQLDWWMFRINGVAGKTVTIDISPNPGPRATLKNWKTLTPVYCEAADLNDPATFSTGPLKVETTLNQQGIHIPATDDQKWHYVENCSLQNDTQFTITQHFTADSAYIAGRIPCPPAYADKFINSLPASPSLKLIDLGKTPENRPLRIVQIGPADDTSQKSKPCIVIAAGEQAYQPDGMWACQGCIEFLLGDSDQAKSLRDQYVFLVIPMLDPDGTADSNGNFIGGFNVDANNPTAAAYANWLQSRILSGGRIDLVLELHSLQSRESLHLQRVAMKGLSKERTSLIEDFQQIITRQFAANQMNVMRKNMTGGPHSPARFSGWVSERLGALDIIYELNAQAPGRHLSLSQLKDTGRLFALAVDDFFRSEYGPRLLASTDKARAAHQTAWNGNASTNPSQDAIESEDAIAPPPANPPQ